MRIQALCLLKIPKEMSRNWDFIGVERSYIESGKRLVVELR